MYHFLQRDRARLWPLLTILTFYQFTPVRIIHGEWRCGTLSLHELNGYQSADEIGRQEHSTHLREL